MRRMLSAVVSAMLIAGLLPLPVLALAPTASADPVTTDEDVPVTITLTSTDADSPGDPTFEVVASPSIGGLGPFGPISCDGGTPNVCTTDLTYTPNPDFNGPDSFTFTATADAETSNEATVAINVDPVNDPPVAAATSTTLDEDVGTWLIAVSASDIEGDDVTVFTVATPPSHGSVEYSPAVGPCGPVGGPWTCVGTMLYTPDTDYNGQDSFTFTATDGTATSTPATVSITVSPVNDRPVANGQSLTVVEDTATAIALGGSDVEGSTLTYTRTGTGPVHGTLTGTVPNLVYTPAANYNGPDSFTFKVNDGTIDSLADATVSITVSPVNDRPVCTGASLSTDKNVAVSGTVACADVEGTPLTLVVSSGPGRGTLNPFNSATGAFTYRPNTDVTGADSFQVTAGDGGLASIPVTVEITIANHAPVCVDASPVAGDEDTIQTGTLGCADGDGDLLTFTKTGGPVHGSVVVDAGTGAWTYTPASNYNGPDSFTFTASDGAVVSLTPATVAITVTAVNDAPVASAQAVATAEDSAKAITLAGTDIEGSALTFAIIGNPAHGTLSGTGPARIYTPAADYSGLDSFTFRVNDGAKDSLATATVSLTIAEVNDAPDARTDGFKVSATGTGTLAVLANDFSGPPSGPVTSEPADTVRVTAVTQGAKVSVSIAPGGTGVLYDVKGCAYGGDSFTYTVADGHGLTDTATAFVTISRPGQDGLSSNPITDTPTLRFITNSTIGSAVPVRLSWCGVTRSGYGVRTYTVKASSNAGATYPTTVVSRSIARSIRRSLPIGRTFRWRARTTDTAGRTGSWRYSLNARASRYQESHRAITYAGTWRTQATSKASGGAERYATTAGAAATITLTNVRQFAIVGPRSARRGSFEVWVDGAKVATVSQRARTTVYRRVLYVRSLTSGPGVSHTIQVRAVGNGRIDVDAVLALS